MIWSRVVNQNASDSAAKMSAPTWDPPRRRINLNFISRSNFLDLSRRGTRRGRRGGYQRRWQSLFAVVSVIKSTAAAAAAAAIDRSSFILRRTNNGTALIMASSGLGVGIFVYSLHDTPANERNFNGKNPALISAAGALIKRMIHSPKKCRCCRRCLCSSSHC